ncbi:GntR family transcriptional regulator [Rhizobium sp. SL42]|uniref:GntR family transcriptional regulator n=1 Tax=Rhizobium sp. SL42 TaxID=2806346 RepID=UPI001F474056|nr:GntR family transcriptional regulator [Rhizobium sp. SL42]UJW73689.1 GntR family transcriptional regulator [Rhizobium sp. SL42]
MQNKSPSQSHLAYLELERQIVMLRLKPGATVSERELIEASGFGRTPVREAIQKLEWQGLIVVRPRVGLQISEIKPYDHRAIMAVRVRLEPYAVRLAAESANIEVKSALADCATAMTAAAAEGDFDAFLRADKAFDVLIESACPNCFLTTALAPLQTHSRRLWYSTATAEKMDRSVAMHVAVIHAIQQDKSVEAERATANLIGYLSEN